MNLFIDQVIVDLIVLKLEDSCGNLVHRLVSSCGENRPKYSTHKNLNIMNTKKSKNIGRQVCKE